MVTVWLDLPSETQSASWYILINGNLPRNFKKYHRLEDITAFVLTISFLDSQPNWSIFTLRHLGNNPLSFVTVVIYFLHFMSWRAGMTNGKSLLRNLGISMLVLRIARLVFICFSVHLNIYMILHGIFCFWFNRTYCKAWINEFKISCIYNSWAEAGNHVITIYFWITKHTCNTGRWPSVLWLLVALLSRFILSRNFSKRKTVVEGEFEDLLKDLEVLFRRQSLLQIFQCWRQILKCLSDFQIFFNRSLFFTFRPNPHSRNLTLKFNESFF